MAVTCTQLDVLKIRIDGGTQIRAELNQSRVEELSELLKEGHIFKDSIVVFYDGTEYWLGDGFHRVEATKLAGLATINADVRSGTREDAIEHACGANATHGLPRNNQDKRNAVKRLLGLPKWQKDKSNREIAKQCGVTEFLVRTIRGELPEDHPAAIKSQKPTNPPVEPAQAENEERIRTPENDTEKRETVEQFFADFPGSEELSNREIAKRCGVSEGLVRKVKKERTEEKQRLEQEEAVRNTSVPVPAPEPEPQPVVVPEPELVLADEPTEEANEPEPTPEPEQPLIDKPTEEVNKPEPDIIPEPELGTEESTEEPTDEQPAPINISGIIVPSQETLLEREIKRQQTQERNEQLREKGADLPQGKYSCLVVDPPWAMKKIERDVRPNQVDFDYPTMTEEELKAFPLPDMAGDDCHLYLWTTQKYLPMALRLAEHWGFKYQCLMTWVKNVGPTPFSWMYTTEHVLFCSKGNLPLLTIGRRLDFVAKGREHSRKPDVFYELVREVSPGPRIDVFSREKREGFDQYGYEVEKYVSA